MGRRKRAQKIIKTQKKAVVAKVFKCPFCTHEGAVECKMNRGKKIGSLSCRICGVKYETDINYLSEPVDVFYEWIDANAKQQEEDRKAALGEADDYSEDEDEVDEEKQRYVKRRRIDSESDSE
eukprot:maker-scaffold_13-snap-gene-2.0-mRNA-1 protein AED:0.02 eAED:0.02 QI:111/1/1/1/1/1/2/362/122